jgi:hypothetical protein
MRLTWSNRSGKVGRQAGVGDTPPFADAFRAMGVTQSDTGYPLPRARFARTRLAFAIALTAAIGLTACGGSSSPKKASASVGDSGQAIASAASAGTTTSTATTVTGSVTQAPASHSQTSASTSQATRTQTSNAVSSPPTTSSSATTTGPTTTQGGQAKHRTAGKRRPTKPKAPAPTTGTKTTIAATQITPTYTGPSPIGCLEAAGLNRARAASEPQVWEANSGISADRNSTVFLSGPYADDDAAQQYAQSLTVVEIAASGGRWVASASIRSNLDAAVQSAAACMAAG